MSLRDSSGFPGSVRAAARAVALALLLAIAGCGSGTSGHPGAGDASKTGKLPRKGPPSEDLSGMVAAVTSSRAGPPVAMKFDLKDRPQVGEPIALDIAILPIAPGLERLTARFQAGEGLTLVDGGESPEVSRPPEGIAIHHTLHLLAKRDGIFTVSAIVAVADATQSITRVFAIPIIAGAGTADVAPKSSAPPPAAAAAARQPS